MKAKIRELFSLSKCSSILLRNFSQCNDSNLYYLTQNPLHKSSDLFLFLHKEKKPLLVCSVLDYTQAMHNENTAVKVAETQKGFLKVLKRELKGKRIGLNLELYPKNSLDRLKRAVKGKKFVDVSSALAELRKTKTKKEIKKISIAVKKTQQVLNRVPKIFRKEMSEKVLAEKLEAMLKEKGVKELAYPTIVASGKNAAVPHHRSGTGKIKKGWLLVDFGGKFEGYCSDLTRTFFVGKAKEKEKEDYRKIKEVQEQAIKGIKVGANSKELFLQANKEFKQYFKKELIHALGHGIGLDVHDFPERISYKNDFKFEKGMVCSIEPAFYKKGWGGIRIEDNVLVQGKKVKRLSKAPKELVEI